MTATPPSWQPPPPHGYYPPPIPQPEPKNGFGITALIVALVGLLLATVPLTGWLAVICGITAVTFGLLGLQRVGRGIATNRTLTQWGTGLAVLTLAAGIWSMTLFFSAMNQLSNSLNSLGNTSTRTASAPVVAPATDVAAAPVQTGPAGITEGTYVVGTDIQPGTYRTAGAAPAPIPNCYFERSKDTSGDLNSILANNNGTGPQVVTIKPSDGAFKTVGCQPWIRVK